MVVGNISIYKKGNNMKFRNLLTSSLVFVTALLLISCSGEKKVGLDTNKGEQESNVKIEKSEKLKITMDKVDISDIEDGKTYQEIKYAVITCNDDTLQKSIDDLNKKLKEVAEEFKYLNKNEVRNMIAELKDENIMYSHDSEASVSYQNEKYLSLLVNTYVFTMGAHGSTTLNGYNYDIKTGKQLKLDDFIKDREELRKYLKDWTAKQEEGTLAEWADATIDEYIDSKEMELQCSIKDGQLNVIFQQYDIAAYAVGIIEVPVDKNLLKVNIDDI